MQLSPYQWESAVRAGNLTMDGMEELTMTTDFADMSLAFATDEAAVAFARRLSAALAPWGSGRVWVRPGGGHGTAAYVAAQLYQTPDLPALSSVTGKLVDNPSALIEDELTTPWRLVSGIALGDVAFSPNDGDMALVEF